MKRAEATPVLREGNPAHAAPEKPGNAMFQVVGSLLALAAVGHVLADAPLHGFIFALLTFAWVVVAKPAATRSTIRYGAPRGAVLGA